MNHELRIKNKNNVIPSAVKFTWRSRGILFISFQKQICMRSFDKPRLDRGKLRMTKSSRGYIAISMVLLLIVVAMAVATSVAFLSIGEGQSGLALEQGEGTFNIVEECAEDLLIRERNDADFASTISSTTFTEPEGTCSLTKSGNTWTITNTSPTAYTHSMQVTFTRDGYGINFTVGTSTSSWKEN